MTPVLRAVGVTPERAAQWAPHLEAAAARFEIGTPARLAAWLAQVAHESCGLERLEENLNYSAGRLMEVWPQRFPELAAAQRFARRPEALADLVYGTRLGNRKPGDGWRFRGRGPLQLTGRQNYRSCGLGIDADLEGNPDALLLPKYGALSAGWYWFTHGCNEFADRGDFAGVTRAINGGLVGYAARLALRDAASKAL